MTVPAVLFYDVVLAVHIAAIVIAFGVTFAYPVIGPFVARTEPRMLPTLHRAQDLVGKRLIAPFGGIALLAGGYLASDRDLWSEVWVTVPLVILIALLLAGGAFFGPSEQKAAELAERDLAASAAGEPHLSDEYYAAVKRIAMGGVIADVAILVAIYFMTVKPFA